MTKRITIIGSGNVATHLSLALEKAGYVIQNVYSRQLSHAKTLTENLQDAVPTDSLNFLQFPVADIYFVCVTDAAVSSVMDKAAFPVGSLVVHTSGSLPIDILQSSQQIKTGVFYPVQTFSKNQPVEFSSTPIAVEANDESSLSILKNVALNLSSSVFTLSSQDRKVLHLAAVFACNFTNHLLGISRELLENYQLDYALLKPLVETTIKKGLQNNPYEVQTGPAVRNDQNVMEAHQQLLEQNQAYHQIYQILSQSIQDKSTLP